MGFFDMFKKKKKEDDFDFSSFKSSTTESNPFTNSELSNTFNNFNTQDEHTFENKSNNFTFSQPQNQFNNNISNINNVPDSELMQEKQFQQSVTYNNFNPPNYDNLKRDLELIIEKINTLKAMIDATDIRLRKIEEMLESHKDQRRYY